MNEIKCQRKHEIDDRGYFGCSTCGGYGYVLIKLKCQCGHEYWSRENRGMTVYDGKRWRSFDGVLITWKDGTTICEFCEVKA